MGALLALLILTVVGGIFNGILFGILLIMLFDEYR